MPDSRRPDPQGHVWVPVRNHYGSKPYWEEVCQVCGFRAPDSSRPRPDCMDEVVRQIMKS
jgi:hypothetical protein